MMLPSADKLTAPSPSPAESMPPCHRTELAEHPQEDNGGKDTCHRACHSNGGFATGGMVATTEDPVAKTLATDNSLTGKEELPRWHGCMRI